MLDSVICTFPKLWTRYVVYVQYIRLHNSKWFERNDLLLKGRMVNRNWSFWATYWIVCHHSSVSLNKENICHEISEDKIAVCKKTQGLRSGNFSDLNSACSKVLVPVKIFRFNDMHYESERYRDAANSLFPLYLFPSICSARLLISPRYK
jgi:hypothetical protein